MPINEHGCWYPDEKPLNWTNEQHEWFKNRHNHDEKSPYDHGQYGDEINPSTYDRVVV
jgi:hypothetical protein